MLIVNFKLKNLSSDGYVHTHGQEIACVRNDTKHFTFNFKQEFLPPNCTYGFGLGMYDAYKSKPPNRNQKRRARAAAKRNDLLSNPAASIFGNRGNDDNEKR